ncbi:MAG: UbiA family prenyltransferase, partial [Desulfobacterales bacterium]
LPMNSIRRIKLFLALSRTPHGILDIAAPAFCALVYLGGFPGADTVGIGLLTAFAGYTAIYALNDVVDYSSDREKFASCVGSDEKNSEKNAHTQDCEQGYLDSMMVRHPMAQGLLPFRDGAAWAAGWAVVALIGAWLLNPVCALIFLAGAALETFYCLLWRVSPWRAVVSGFVKNMGAAAALFAVDPDPSFAFMLLVFACLFFWEIGGQNIPADWTDMEQDRRLKAQTIPVRLGAQKSSALALLCLCISLVFCMILFFISFPSARLAAPLAAVVIGSGLLVEPAFRLYKNRRREDAMALFNRASYFPASMLTIAVILII